MKQTAVKPLNTHSNFQDLVNTNYEHEPLTTRILYVKKATTLIYKNSVISNKNLTSESSQNMWLEDCSLPINDNINWTAAYWLKKCTSLDSYIDAYQPITSYLEQVYRVMRKQSNCQTSSQSLIHIFWSYRQTSHFWNKVAEWLKKLNLLPRYYTLTNITALDLRPDISRF